jgi:hypothetical protein
MDDLTAHGGFVVDVGDLMRLVVAKEGARSVEDVARRSAHELSACLWSVLVLADRYGVDLERVFLQTMDDLEQTIRRQLAAHRPAQPAPPAERSA